MKHHPLLRPARQQFLHVHGQPLQLRQFLRLRIRDKQEVQVGTVINFTPAQFAEADDDERRRPDFVFAHDNFKRVLQAGVGERGEFGEILLEIGEAQDVAQAEAHQFSLVIAAQPEKLVFVIVSVAQILQNLRRHFALAQAPAGHKIVNQIRIANGGLGQKFGTVEQQQHQFKRRRVAVPHFKQRRARAVSLNEAVQTRHHAVGIGKNWRPMADTDSGRVLAQQRSCRWWRNFGLWTLGFGLFFWTKRQEF